MLVLGLSPVVKPKYGISAAYAPDAGICIFAAVKGDCLYFALMWAPGGGRSVCYQLQAIIPQLVGRLGIPRSRFVELFIARAFLLPPCQSRSRCVGCG